MLKKARAERVDAAEKPSPLRLSGTNNNGAVQLAHAKVDAIKETRLVNLFLGCFLKGLGSLTSIPPYPRDVD